MQLRLSRAVPTLFAAALVAMTAGCAGASGGPDPIASNGPNGNFEIRGSVVSVDVGRRLLEINHEAIPGFMPAMTMPYEVADAALLQGLAVGDRVHGTLRVDSRGYVITALEKG
jgi:protein SCO1/2